MARPSYTLSDKETLLSKLEPYLMAGMSLNKACSEAQVSRSTVYLFMDEDEWFLNRIHQRKQYISILVNNAVLRELITIVDKQNAGIELCSRDVKYLEWFALHSNLIEEFGRREQMVFYDPELEIQKLNRLLLDHSDNQNRAE